MLSKEADFVISPASKRILLAFSSPSTPKKAMHLLCVRKIKFQIYVNAGLLKCLNPEEKRARFYVLTEKARKLLSLPPSELDLHKDWECIGWIISSPKMKLTVLRFVDGIRYYFYQAIDARSKFAFSLQYDHLNSQNTVGFFKKLEKIYTEHGRKIELDCL